MARISFSDFVVSVTLCGEGNVVGNRSGPIINGVMTKYEEPI